MPAILPLSPTPNNLRILIIDEYDVVRQALALRLNRLPSLVVVGDTGNYEHGATEALQLKPDVVLLELKGVHHQIFDPVRKLLRIANYPLAVIVLTSYPDEDERAQALMAGAQRYLLKDINSEQLVAEMHHAVAEARATWKLTHE